VNDTRKKWLIGCGIGCAVVLLLLILGGVGLFQFFKSTFIDFKHAGESQKNLFAQYGEVSEFAPPADGGIPAARLDAFLEVRGSLDDVRNELLASFRTLQELDRKEEEEKSFKMAWSAVKSGVGFGRLIGRFISTRNDALLSQEMGLGEYTYIYIVAYHSWLQHPMTLGFDSYDEDADIPGQAVPSDYARRLHDDLLAMLRNQLGALDEAGDPGGLRDSLEAEISLMEEERYRLPWQDGLPEAVIRSLELYRPLLEQSYSPFLGVLELAVDENEGDFSINFG
jgi:hypothetical protein